MADKILVTGGSGFIGAALVKRLVSEGHAVTVFDNNSRGSRERLKSCWQDLVFIEGDIRNKAELIPAVQNCQIIYHLAFVNGTRFFYEQPRLVLDVGVKGVFNTVELALEHGVRQYILASSSEIYQQPEQVPTPESVPAIIPDVRNPRFSYAGGKLISELVVLNYLRDTDVRASIFRPHNIFGPDMGFEHVIPEFMQKLHTATEGWHKPSCEIQIQGTGEETRAFCYVEDAVDQILLIQKAGLDGEVYHIGQCQERTILDLIRDISRILGIQVAVVPGQLRSGGTSRRCPDISKVRALGYASADRYQAGLENTVTWYRDFFSSKEPC